MSDYFATTALLPDGQLKKIQLEDYLGKFVLLIFYHGDFDTFAKSELLAFADQNGKFVESDCQIIACSTDSGETHVAWTTQDFDETCLGKNLPFPLLADHSQALVRKFDLLDSNQGNAKHAYLILDPKGTIRHKQIGDGKVAFNIEEALVTLSSCKLPVFEQSSFEEDPDPPNELPPPPPEAPLPEDSDQKGLGIVIENCNSEKESEIGSEKESDAKSNNSVELVDDVAGVKIVVTQPTKDDLFDEKIDDPIDNPKEEVERHIEVVDTDDDPDEDTFEIIEANAEPKVEIVEAISETKVEIIEVNSVPKVVENEVVVSDAKIEVVDEIVAEVQSEIQEKSSIKSNDKEEATVPAKIEVTVPVQEDQVDAVNPNADLVSDNTVENVTETEVLLKEPKVVETVEKVDVKAASIEVVEVVEEESSKATSDPVVEIEADKKSTSTVSEAETITSKNEPSTPATAEIDEIEQPSEEKKVDIDKDSKDENNAGEKPSEELATVESLTETLKRDLTLKRKEDEMPNPEPVPNVQATQVDQKKKSKGCCTLM